MHRIFWHRLFAAIFTLGGAYACLVANFGLWVPHGPEQRAQILASLIAVSMCGAGLVWFFRPKYGIALAIATLIPQVFSFALGSVSYALHLWPNYRVEFFVPGRNEDAFGTFVHAFTSTAQATVETDANYAGFGFGVEIISFSVLLFLGGALVGQRRHGGSPN